MEKLLLYYMLHGDIPPNATNLDHIDNPLAWQVVRQMQLLAKNKKVPTVTDLIAVFKSTQSNTEALKLEAYMTAALKSDTSLSPDDVVDAVTREGLLRQAEGTITELAEAAISKDIPQMQEHLATLQKATTGASGTAPTKLGEDIDNNIFMLPSVFPTLNAAGCRLTGVTVVGAPSGVGKSAFSTQEVVDKFLHGHSSVYFSLELPAKLLEARVLANLANVDLGHILSDLLPEDIRVPLTPEERKAMADARALLASPDTPDIIIYDNLFDGNTIEALIRQHAADGVKLFVIDYLNLMEFKTSNSDASGWIGKSQFVRLLNQLCLALGIVVLLPTQVDIEKGTDGKLVMRTRGTTELLNTSSLALLLYRPPDVEGMLQLSVTKARNAFKVDVGLGDELRHQRFADLGRI